MLEANSGLILLRGRWVEVDAAKLPEALAHWLELQDEYSEGISFIEGMRLLAGVRLDGDSDDGESPEWSRVNASSAQTRTVKKLDAQGRIVLTGKLVENHLGDLWSIFDFCCPGLLGTAAKFKAFVKRLSQPENLHGYGALRRLVDPYILRRLKTDRHIAPVLPAKTEMRVECGLSKKQAVLYEQVVPDLQRRPEDADDMARRGPILSVFMQLKQLGNHPSQYLNEAAFPPEQSGKFQPLAEIGQEEFQMREVQGVIFFGERRFDPRTKPWTRGILSHDQDE